MTHGHTTGPLGTRQVQETSDKKSLEPGAYEPAGTFLFVKHPTLDELRAIYALTVREIGETVTGFNVVKSVYEHNPVSFWAFMRTGDDRRKDPELVGFCGFLPLNEAGLVALKQGELDARMPAIAHLAPATEPPLSFYIWAVVAHGTADLGGKLIGHAIGLDLYERLPIFGTVGTQSGLNAIKKRGNSPQSETADIGSFFEIRHPKSFLEQMRALEVHWPRRSQKPQLETRLAATHEEIAKVFALRSAVFLAEQDCPYEEEFDGNDFAGAHILGLVNDEPAAVLRVRYFAGFVKLERLAVLPRFRRTLIAKHVVEHAIQLCRRKGYTKMYGHAQKRLVGLWERFGFVVMNKNMHLVFSDHEYV